MKNNLSKPVKLTILAIVISMIFLGVSTARAINSANTIWYWRQPPYENYYSGGWLYTVPWVEVVAWGGVDKKVIYAGNSDRPNESSVPHGIYRSADYGITWDYLGKVDENEAITKLVVHPTKPNIVIAGFDRTYYQAGIYRSNDSGESWTNVLPYLAVNDVEIDPSNPSVIYATGSLSAGMVTNTQLGTYKSIDEGQIWQHISTSGFSDIEVSPIASNVLFGAARIYEDGGILQDSRIYRSEDFGKTWTQISDIREKNIIINENNPNQMFIFGESYDGIWRTDDAGASWHNVTSNLPHIIADPTVLSAVIDPLSPNTIWIGLKYGGMYVSHDSGESWQEKSNGIPFMGASIGGPQCTAGDISNGQLLIACSGRVFVQSEMFTKKILSTGISDGWVLESTETSNKGGAKNNTAITFRLGDEGSNEQYRSILSFNTGAVLPDTAVINKVTLKFKKSGVVGYNIDPVSAFRGFKVDIKKGFFGKGQLEAGDFQAAASKSYGSFASVLSKGWYGIDLTTGRAYINKLSVSNGVTQIRLQFKLDDDNYPVASYLELFSGNAPTASRPQLIVEYYVP